MADLFFDTVKLSDPRIGSDGVFRTTVTTSRVGVMPYSINGKKVRRFRSPKVVLDSLESFNMAVVTKDHPVNDSGAPILVDAKNREKFQIGMTSRPRLVDGWTKADIAITDAEGIKAAQTTHKYVSVGCNGSIVSRAGVFVDSAGEVGPAGAFYPFDEEIVSLSGNHLAITPFPRAGKQAVMDSRDLETTVMPKIVIDNVEQEVSQEFYDSYLKANEQRVIVDSNPVEPTADQIAREVNKRQAAYESAKVFLGDSLEFDGSKTSVQWMCDALDSAKIPYTQDNVEAVFTGAVHGRHQYNQETSPVERFAFQVDSDQANYNRLNSKPNQQKPQDLDARANQMLADAQAEEMAHFSNPSRV